MLYRTCILILLLIFIGSFAPSFAEDSLTIIPISESKKQALLENESFFYITKEPAKRAIKCFDVHPDGDVAIGSAKSTEKTVCVYSSQGLFKYGYRFHSSGDYGVEFEGENLVIWFLRSDIAFTINPTGGIVEVREFENTKEYSSYWRDKLRSKTRKIEERVYTIKNDRGFLNAFGSSYSQLILTDENGETHILYDVNADQFPAMVLKFVLIAILVIFWFGFMSYALIRFRKVKKNIQ